MSNEPIDRSDELVTVRTLISLLTEYDPDGRWKNDPIVKKRQRSPYSLTQKEFDEMATFLEAEWSKVKPKGKIYLQPKLFGGANEQNL
ncbi:MAG: hypothetical protein LH660_00980 [Phormidesmis sp. CAN_BIN36]|nr:hypothetical protein [Phormidesmis sp. CAN_BIN36]